MPSYLAPDSVPVAMISKTPTRAVRIWSKEPSRNAVTLLDTDGNVAPTDVGRASVNEIVIGSLAAKPLPDNWNWTSSWFVVTGGTNESTNGFGDAGTGWMAVLG